MVDQYSKSLLIPGIKGVYKVTSPDKSISTFFGLYMIYWEGQIKKINIDK